MNGGIRGLAGLTKFLESKAGRKTDEESVWVFANIAGQKLPIHKGFNVEFEGPFTMIYPLEDAMTDRWDGQHSQGGGDKSAQAMGGRGFVKHSGDDHYGNDQEIDEETGMWKSLADLFRKQRDGSLKGGARFLEGTMIGGVKSIIIGDSLKELLSYELKTVIEHLARFKNGKQIDYSVNFPYFNLMKRVKEDGIVFKDERLNPAKPLIFSNMEDVVEFIFKEKKETLLPRDFNKIKRILKNLSKQT